MWRRIQISFGREKAKLTVVRKMLDLGIRVNEEGRLAVSDVEVGDIALSRALHVDRRVVRGAVEKIVADPELRQFFIRLRPGGVSLKEAAPQLGYRVIEITADASQPGVI